MIIIMETYGYVYVLAQPQPKGTSMNIACHDPHPARLPWKRLALLLPGLALASTSALAQTAGQARLEARILDYTGTSNTRHWAIVWVTTASGTFIKTLWLQGESYNDLLDPHWADHCGVWAAARGTSTALDGYTSATAQTYTGTNSPIILTWNCRNAANAVVADGDYKFWVQYAENSGQGPYTTSGLTWTKSPTGATNTYPNQGANFADMRVTWTPAPPATVAPTITSAAPPGSGTVGVAYNHTVTATGTAPIAFTASNLPPGLVISPAGVISGLPNTGGAYNGAIRAANGTPPDALQAFSIAVAVVPVTIGAVGLNGNNLVISGTGPANGTYAVLAGSNVGQSSSQWTPLATNSINGAGVFSFSTPFDAGVSNRYYRLRMP